MNISRVIFSTFILLATLSCAAAHSSEQWNITDAGNVTCKEWGESNLAAQNEVLSWMAGFASAVNVTYASQGRSQLPLEKLTYNYLRHEISSECFINGNSKVTMLVLIFKTLKEFPFKEHP